MNRREGYISSAAELRKDTENERKWREKWTATFPSASSSYAAKLDWARKIIDDDSSIFDKTFPDSPIKILQAILARKAPKNIEVQLVANRTNLESLGLKEVEVKTVFEDDATSKYAVVASKAVPKSSSTRQIIDQLLKEAGVTREPMLICPVPKEQNVRSKILFEVPDTVGGSLYFPIGANRKQAAAFQIVRLGEPKSDEILQCEEIIRALKEQNEKDHRDFHLTDSGPIFYSHKDEFKRVSRHFSSGEGESSQIKKRLRKGNTDSNNLKVVIFMHNFYRIMGMKNQWALKFSALLAITIELMEGDMYWANDNEEGRMTKMIISDIADYWRLQLLTKDDDALGIGFGDASTGKKSRDALISLLALTKEEIEGCGMGWKFNYSSRGSKRQSSDAASSSKSEKKNKTN